MAPVELRFDGRVAVVTGAGRGIGRAHALLLAQRGCAVVVNDVGSSVEGAGADAGPAAAVAAEIEAAGGAALAETSDVATSAGAEAVVRAALDRFGRLDILINNAGIIRWAGMPRVDEQNLVRHLAVHTLGSFNTARAAWPSMTDQGYGRVVMTTSSGIFGLPENTSYATAKAAVIGLSRSLALAGREHGIKVNCLAPAAVTRMAGAPSGTADETKDETNDETNDGASGASPGRRRGGPMSPEQVAPMAAYLAHEDCPVTGEIFEAGAGRFARIFIASTPGYVHPDPEPTIEDVADHWRAISDETGYSVPRDLMAWSAAFLSHLGQPGGAAGPSRAPGATPSS